VAVGFDVPVAAFVDSAAVGSDPVLATLGPDLLAGDFDVREAVRRLRGSTQATLAEALPDPGAVAGIGNVFKSEVLFVRRLWPFLPPGATDDDAWEAVVTEARRQLRANVVDHAALGFATTRGMRQTTGRLNPAERLWVYGRMGRPCRRCGTRIEMRRQGVLNRSTYYCPRCQQRPSTAAASPSQPR